MFKAIKAIIVTAAVLMLPSCTATKSIILEYDAQGNLVKSTETSESVVKEVTASTKDKTVVAWESGWAAYISASTATTQDPTPTMKMFAGKTDKGLISALPDQQNWNGIAETVNATKYELSVSSSGISSSSGAVPQAPESSASVLPVSAE